jgi:phosphate transport system substrate-binding protein
MFKSRNIAILLGILMLIAVPFAGVFAQDGTVVDVAAGDEQFSTLVSLVEAAGLVETLNGEGPFTVFAPTNEAFAELPQFVIDYLGNHPDLLTRVLTYHVVPGQVMAADVTALEDGTMVETVEGSSITVGLDDMGVMVDGATVTATDVMASNGVIHVIDSVIVPPIELPQVIPADVTGDIITAGSSTVGPLTIAIANAFKEEGYPGQISVDIIGSGAGFERFCEAAETDISNASRAIREEEVASCEENGRNPVEFRVGTDAISVVVNPGSVDFVENLSLEQLATAFSTAETWADVDPSFPELPITRFIPGTDSGTFDYFVEVVFDEDEGPILAASNTQLSENDNVLVEGVANTEGAIGFFGYAFYADNQDILNILSVDDVPATPANVDAGTYPLARPLFIYSAPGIIEEKPQVGQFIIYYLNNVQDFLISEVTIGEGNVVITDEGEEVGEYSAVVAYFPANPFELNLSRLEILALTDMGMM